jgi:hypothetical protein
MNERVQSLTSGRLRLGAVIAIAVAAGFIAWLVFKGDDEPSTPAPSPAVAASVSDLRALAKSVKHPIYWAGRKPGQTYELTQTSSGNIYIRYLPAGVAVGVPRPDYLTVGTYPFRHPAATLQKQAKNKGAIGERLPNGGVLYAAGPRPPNAYFAYPNSDVEIEVFDPKPGRALRLVRSGRIVPL